MSFDTSRVRAHLNDFNFRELFIEELGWSRPTERQKTTIEVSGENFERQAVAELSGVVVYEITSAGGTIPDAKTRRAIHAEVSRLHYENLLIFLDRERTQSLWYWAKREGKKTYPRDHTFMRGQPADLFLQKLSGMVVDISELDEEGNIAVTEVASKLKGALDVERVTKKFYNEFRQEHVAFIEHITGIDDEHDRRWYASVLLNRLMFIYFLQSKGFIKGHEARQAFRYLQDELKHSRERGLNRYYSEFLDALFFEGFAKPEADRSAEARKLVGGVPYLNGGLFLKHGIEERWPKIAVPDVAFENLFRLFESYSWNLDDTPGGRADEINPDVLGYIFEKYINQKAFGAYYTRTEITQYLCEQTIYKLILDRINAYALPPPPAPHTGELFTVKDHNLFASRRFDAMGDLLLNLDSFLCRKLLDDILPDMKLLDPACGSGAFLVAAMKTLVNVYQAIISYIEFHGDAAQRQWLDKLRREHSSLSYYVKREIIKNNLFGVDIMEEATEIAKLRLFLALVASVERADQLEPLPNIDFNILTGHSLIGLLRIDEKDFDKRKEKEPLLRKGYRDFVRETTNDIRVYRRASSYEEDLRALRDNIEQKKREVTATLDEILLDQFQDLGIKFEQATWDEQQNKEGKPVKRKLMLDDIRALRPFHWGFEFDEIINSKGGFDAIIANPPWEVFKPNSKEFFIQHSDLVKKKKMDIKDFEKEKAKLLKDPEIAAAWIEYLSSFPYVSAYFRAAKQYENQISIVNDKKVGTDINLYKLFLEQCFNLVRPHGRCGLILQGGIYNDLGAKQLRELLFGQCDVGSLFGLSNEKYIFENVHHSQKICILTFEKGGRTESFKASFRINPREAISPAIIGDFLNSHAQHVDIPTSLVRRLSPDSLAVMEFKNDIDLRIIEKMVQISALGSQGNYGWSVQFTREVNNMSDMKYVADKQLDKYVPLYEGKNINQYDHAYDNPRYFIDIDRYNSENSQSLKGQYPSNFYRLCFRRQARSTDKNTFIGAVAPKHILFFDNLGYVKPFSPTERLISHAETLFLLACLNSYTLQFVLRQLLNSNLSFYLLYQLPVPRLTNGDSQFGSIVERVGRLVCTTSEFDDLARDVGLKDHSDGAINSTERAQLRAEIEGKIAHLYSLTEAEFAYILSTFPLLDQSEIEASLEQFRRFAPIPDDHTLAENIKKLETDWQELKVAACWNPFTSKKDDSMRENIIQAVASFLNSREGGALIIGVDASGNVVGLEDDYKAADPKQPNRDGYERFLRNILNSTLGAEFSPLYKFIFGHVGGKEICHIKVDPSPRPVFHRGDMYIRDGNGKRKLTAQAAVAYQKHRWS